MPLDSRVRGNDNRGITRSESGQALKKHTWIPASAIMKTKGVRHELESVNSLTDFS